jgi:hypothetical protein
MIGIDRKLDQHRKLFLIDILAQHGPALAKRAMGS